MKNMTSKFIIEGLDRLGKSTLIKGIRDELGYYEVIHFSKPEELSIYKQLSANEGEENRLRSLYMYQAAGFRNMMHLLIGNAKIIFDRGHLGEAVYSPMYRSYSGDYVFELEREYCIDQEPSLKLILLIEDFRVAKHFVDDGESLGPREKRAEEQVRFIEAYTKSCIQDKKIICVTDEVTGGFRSKHDILREALV